MASRTSVNKRQRELLRKERQAEKLSRRDQRRTKQDSVASEESNPDESNVVPIAPVEPGEERPSSEQPPQSGE